MICLEKLRDLSLGPMTLFQRPICVSIRLRWLYPVAVCQAMHPVLRIWAIWRSRTVASRADCGRITFVLWRRWGMNADDLPRGAVVHRPLPGSDSGHSGRHLPSVSGPGLRGGPPCPEEPLPLRDGHGPARVRKERFASGSMSWRGRHFEKPERWR